jgi:hypothetical protein
VVTCVCVRRSNWGGDIRRDGRQGSFRAESGHDVDAPIQVRNPVANALRKRCQ